MIHKPSLLDTTLDQILKLKSTVFQYETLLHQALNELWQSNPDVAAKIEGKLDKLESKP